MLVWGGNTAAGVPRNGGRYNPATDTWKPLSWRPGVTLRRLGHTAVWTGTEMIVWGGRLPNDTAVRTGDRYNPTTESWAPTSVGANVPASRGLHTAVWTGTRMVVWGGVGILIHDTGGRYDPATDTWLPTSTVNAPAARYLHGAVWTGSRMLVWGGSLGLTSDGSGGRYDPDSDSWTPMSTVNAPPGRIGFSAVWTGSLFLVYGGSVSAQPGTVTTDQGARYDPASDTWTAFLTTPLPPLTRTGASAVWTGSEMIVWGGSTYPGGGMRQDLGTGGRYDPATNSWSGTPVASGPSARSSQVAQWTGSEMIVWGGGTPDNAVTTTGGRYQPATNSWVPTSMGSPMPGARRYPEAVWTGAELIVWGGLLATSGNYVNDGGRYNPATDSWSLTSIGTGVPAPRQVPSVVWTGSRMLVWGGLDLSGNETNAGSRYDPAGNTWTSMTTTGAPAARAHGSAVWSGTQMVVWGGVDTDCTLTCSDGCCGTVFNTGGRYDPVSDTWLPTSTGGNVPVPRWTHVAVWTGSRMIVWGGLDADDLPLTTGGIYDPATDTWQPTAAGLPAAGGGSAVWSGSEMLVWEKGTWNGARYDPVADSWRSMSSAGAPHTDGGVVWAGGSMQTWGGVNLDTGLISGEGGRYDPVTDHWSPLGGEPGAPVARTNHAVVSDGGGLFVWGGMVSSSGGDNSTDSGARYCSCVSGVVFYRDFDGDDYGNQAVSVSPCDGVAPAGYVATSGDCDDSNFFIHPGALELCDGIDNNCDTAIDNTALAPAGPVTWTAAGLFTWPMLEQATGYDVVYGDLALLRSSAGDFTTATIACHGDDTDSTEVPFPYVPAVGNGVWLLVRGVNCGGPGSYDGEAGQAGSRDAEIAAAPNHCP
jgi:N-acetylneuraminic acid mutarotase